MGTPPWLATVTVPGVQAVVTVRVTLRIRLTLRTGALRAILRAFHFLGAAFLA
ncbi:hypothetical protein [Sphingorhabdus sp.]|uniref:hypothetical protein n=1 Tax=Sphingorhabdus sp. TaxID=1902408 RepID=UPI003BB1C29C|nr:hypothetical protein [Sphingomonadales bacterium]MBL0021038.1 hypothetical protein [Sphingomonadales bacterium]